MLQAFGEQQNFLRSATRIDTEAIAATVSGAMTQQLTHAFTFMAENQRALIAALPLSEPRREDRPLALVTNELREEVRQLVQLELRDRQRGPEVSAAMPQLYAAAHAVRCRGLQSMYRRNFFPKTVLDSGKKTPVLFRLSHVTTCAFL